MKKILLTTVFGPFGREDKYNKKGDDLLLDFLASRISRESGLFALSSHTPHSALHLIAANLPAVSKVMEYPTEQEFLAELKRAYDYLGISFIIKGYRKVLRMISLARRYAPGTKIVIGGFGTALHNIEALGADHICRGEGVRFMRELLGVPAGQGVIHPTITAGLGLGVLRDCDFIRKPRIGLITSGFGCPGACEFCSTSAFFGHKHIPFLESGAEIYRTMVQMSREAGVQHFLIFEEDFMRYKKRLRELGQMIREDADNHFTYGCFASVKSLSAWDLQDLVTMGLEHVWIGVESREIHLRKREGRDIMEIFKEMHALGVTTTGSMIFGLDHHTPEKLEKEVEFMAALNPSTFQIANLMAAQGTPLWKRLQQEQRIRNISFKDADCFSEMVDHPRFRPGEINAAIFRGYHRIYHQLGPSIYRIFRTWLEGYKNLNNLGDPCLKKRSLLYAERVKNLIPLFSNTCKYLPNPHIRRGVRNTLEECDTIFGPLDEEDGERAKLIGRIFTEAEQGIKHPAGSSNYEPVLKVTQYNACSSREPIPLYGEVN